MRALLVGILAAASCGQNPCDRLAEFCEACENPDGKEECQSIVREDITLGCENALFARVYEKRSATCRVD